MIRNETDGDINAVADVVFAAFFSDEYSNPTEPLIVAALRDAGALTLSIVAEIDNKLVGHVAVSPVSISDGSENWYGLGPISVSPDRQRQGIGSMLMKSALASLRDKGAAGCVLLGDPGYYIRFGFKPDGRLILPDVPPEYFQAVSFTGTFAEGFVTYHEAFNAND